MERLYRVGEFAERTGVSIRTLHHYDQIGLLQQVLTLRYLGFSLKQIAELLAAPDFNLVASMWRQRLALRERISTLERIVEALGELVDRRLASGDWDWERLAQASAAVQEGLEQKGAPDVQNYITPELQKQFEKLGRQVPAAEREA